MDFGGNRVTFNSVLTKNLAVRPLHSKAIDLESSRWHGRKQLSRWREGSDLKETPALEGEADTDQSRWGSLLAKFNRSRRIARSERPFFEFSGRWKAGLCKPYANQEQRLCLCPVNGMEVGVYGFSFISW